MATVTFDKATRVYPGSEGPAVDALDLHIEDGEFLVLVGPSGCGKSTSLRMLAGLEDVDRGDILIGDRKVTDLKSKDRDIAMVFQSYALYPHMTVAENMGFALKIAGTSKEEIQRRVAEAAKILDLEPFLDRRPKALSGGQRQRVAMGRAIVRSPGMNIAELRIENGHAVLGTARIPLPRAASSALADEAADRVIVGFRPESLDLVSENDPGAFAVNVGVVEELGSDAFLHGTLSDLAEGASIENGL